MKRRLAWFDVRALSRELVERLRPGCERIEVAGSFRRGRPMVGDIELVAVPRVEAARDMFGLEVALISSLDAEVGRLGVVLLKDGEKFKQFIWNGIQVDLFVQPDPATWGVNFMLRTGSADFSKWMMTPRSKGGAMPGGMRVAGSRLWRDGVVVETPEERDVFREMGVAWMLPLMREAGLWNKRPWV